MANQDIPDKALELLEKLRSLTDACEQDVEKRVSEFKGVGSSSEERIFQELCFCVLTANFSAKGGMFIQERLGDAFLNMREEDLKLALRDLGYRFWNPRYKFIAENRRLLGSLKPLLQSEVPTFEKRSVLVKEVKGFGMKEASHFLRNVGLFDVAILDRHILRVMKTCDLIEEVPRSLTQKTYLAIEQKFFDLASAFGAPAGIFDLYVWFMEKGRVEK